MKKWMVLLVMVVAFSFPVSAFADNQKQIDELKIEIQKEQVIYDTNVKIASEYLDKLLNVKVSIFEKIEYRIKLQHSRNKYNKASENMLELKKELYELTVN